MGVCGGSVEERSVKLFICPVIVLDVSMREEEANVGVRTVSSISPTRASGTEASDDSGSLFKGPRPKYVRSCSLAFACAISSKLLAGFGTCLPPPSFDRTPSEV